jgi:hypothetical protein
MGNNFLVLEEYEHLKR